MSRSRYAVCIMGAAAIGLLCWCHSLAADDRGRFPLEIKEVHDGDTLLATVRLPWRVSLGPEAIRAADYDAWEISRARRTVEVTDDELAKGKASRDYLAKLVENGNVYIAPQAGGKRDVYGRLLGELWLRRDGEWISVADEMKRKGHVRRSAGDGGK